MRPLIITLCLLSTPALADVTGPARIVDGDSLEVAGERVRLHGIDAPEIGQLCSLKGEPWSCGRAAADLLRDLIDGQEVDCRYLGRDRYKRMIAKCKVGWLDLGAEMVTRGMAVAYLRYSNDYLQNYREARGKGNGIFAGEFVEPEKWRQGERHAVEIANDNAPMRCQIKGNINSKGKRIYHMPGQEAYNVTRINPGAGERWFCSEVKAKAAGWRKALR